MPGGENEVAEKKHRMDPEQIEQSFADAGWYLDAGFAGYLVIGYDGNGLSILASEEEACETDDPTFELLDHERDLTHWVREIPSPQQAQELLREHGEPPPEG
jgi:hypothetical protein